MDKSFRSGCPINLTLETLGDRWSLIVIRDVMFGNRRHYRELLNSSGRYCLEHLGRPAEEAGGGGFAVDQSGPGAQAKTVYSLTGSDPTGAASRADGGW